MVYQPKSSAFARMRTSNAFIAFVVCTAIFSDSFVYDLIIPFIPHMLEHRLHLPADQVQIWTSTLLGVFGAAFAIGNLIAGYLTDHSPSTKFPFLLGMVTMIASSLMFFLGEHIAVAVAARALQGLSASFVWVSGLAFMTSNVSGSFIGKAMGYVSVGMAAGELLGPLVGGAMYEHAGHYAVLALVCAILGVDVALRLLLADKESNDSRGSTGAALEDDEERPLLDEGPVGEADVQTPVAEDAGVTSSKTIDIFGLRLDRELCASFYAVCVIGTIRYSFESSLSIFVLQRFSWSTSASGGIVFAFLGPAAFGPLVGHFTTKYGPRWFTVVLFGVSAIGLVGLGLFTQPSTVVKVFFVITVAVVGICMSSLTTIQSIAFSVAAKRREMEMKRAGKSSSTGADFGGFSMAWTTGMFIGPLAAELFVDHVNWLAYCLFLAGLCAISGVIMSFTWKEWEIPEDEGS
ncbi:MFS general substrate transporter [Pseudovirgaria hyperparasitica]|uniref:MFS general substrate transporter n=1 Tax=Pseudovirgaria hyperparasitica TaxID=470096 RepID=A0A6A6W0E9_9PEZI|nr:MFS general substrate transporter [Pseudovirgaria hyperparasitica]KAF2755566.1 MFS general substrate transporter [Pseudovirgaria hyperparasitica]